MWNKTSFYKVALQALYYSGAYHLLRDRFRGIGVLLTLHHVEPEVSSNAFAPNRILSITPEFLDSVIGLIRELGWRIVSLDELKARLDSRDSSDHLVSFTLDDGYADNFTHAYPVFRRHEVPFTIYLCTGLLNGTVDPWWQELENVVRSEARLRVKVGAREFDFVIESVARKWRAYEAVYWSLRQAPLEEQQRAMNELRARYPSFQDGPAASNEPLRWNMIREMMSSGLLTLGAHTENHYALSKLSAEGAEREIESSRAEIESKSGVRPRHVAYPYGDAQSASEREFQIVRKLGFATAVTTRKGVIYPEHGGHTAALPRVSLNGDYQQLRYVKLFLSGLPFAIANGFRRIDVS